LKEKTARKEANCIICNNETNLKTSQQKEKITH